MSLWVFTLILTFTSVPPKAPLFGHRVEVRIEAESESACEAVRRVLTRELVSYRVRHEIPTPCVEITR